MKVTENEREVIFKVIWIMRKMNMLNRGNTRQLLEVMKDKAPDDIQQWLKDDYSKMMPVKRGK